MNKSQSYFLLLVIVAVPFIIYLYFLNWRTNVIYGDDLNIFMAQSGLSSIRDRMNMDIAFGKLRPIHGFATDFLIRFFQKNLQLYYLFNVSVQVINTFLLALILNLFLRNPLLSIAFGLIAGLSGFTFFNIAQLFNGGALEGLAMTFFLLSLFFLVRIMMKDDLGVLQKQKGILFSLLFANVSMYTHERYIVIFPFIILVLLFLPVLKSMGQKRRILLMMLAAVCVLLNIVIKKYFFSMVFLMGTSGTDIAFSYSAAISFFGEAVLSIFQFNTGPEYLVGISFSGLPAIDKAVVIALFLCLLSLLLTYLFAIRKAIALKEKDRVSKFSIFLLLIALFGVLLIPAVVTIRLEQRWLQASFNVFILLVAIAVSDLTFSNHYVKHGALGALVMLFVWTEYNYLHKGANKLYMMSSENVVNEFEEAANKGIIRPDTKTLYIMENKRDLNTENAIQWDLGGGSFFNFYQHAPKKIVFVDSNYDTSIPAPFDFNASFNIKTDQIVYFANNVIDITKDYLKDSLRSIKKKGMDQLANTGKIQYSRKKLVINADPGDAFLMDGFYDNEHGIRWTNGNARIGFKGDYTVKDSLGLVLTTYMPPVCNKVNPDLSLIDEDGRVYQPLRSKREGDNFIFKFYFKTLTTIQAIHIVSDRIKSDPDIRILSFPFISLEISN